VDSPYEYSLFRYAYVRGTLVNRFWCLLLHKLELVLLRFPETAVILYSVAIHEVIKSLAANLCLNTLYDPPNLTNRLWVQNSEHILKCELKA